MGKPTAEGLRFLKEQGFRTVVDLRMPEEGTAAEEARARELGLAYVAIPVTAASFSVEDVQKLETVLDDAKARPVLIHCSSGNRVGGAWAVHLVRKGRVLAEAEAEGEAIGLRAPAMKQAVRRVLGRPDDP